MNTENRTATATHTPGPWETDMLAPDLRTGDLFVVRSQDYGWRIAAVAATNKPIGQANARVIAAAPDMLAALQSLVSNILDYERANNLSPNPGRKYCWDSVLRAVNAIAKATGGTVTEQASAKSESVP